MDIYRRKTKRERETREIKEGYETKEERQSRQNTIKIREEAALMILGLDMATKKTGYGLLDEEANLYDYGVIRTINSEPRDRIKEVYDAIEEIINNNNITHIVLEDVPVTSHNNLKTGKDLCILQGAILALCFKYNIQYSFYAPSSWRSIIGTYDGTRQGMKRDVQKQKAVDKINELYDLDFVYNATETKTRHTDDDKAEAICLGLAYIEDIRRPKNEV